MNTDKQTTDKQRLLDLLVDGELSDAERRDVLAWCEREPDGWRRCALAFLEAQDWSSVLGSLADTSHEMSQRATAVVQPAVTGGKTLTRPNAFWNVRQWGTMLAMAASVVLAFTLGLWLHDAGKVGQIAPAGRPALNVVSNGPTASSDDWSPVEAAAVPDDVRQALERLGHRVEQQRRLVPYRLDDGRRVVIPVDQVQVRPVEIESFQ